MLSLDQFLVCEKKQNYREHNCLLCQGIRQSSNPPTFDTSAAKRPTMGQSNQECKETSQSNV